MPPRPAAVLFDRDGTLVADVPYNTDPDAVRPLPAVAEAVALLRRYRVPTAVVTNQSGVGRGLLTMADVHRVNARIDQLLGPFDAWAVCPHPPAAGCGCRKPAPGLLLTAARRLRVPTRHCLVVGDIGADLAAARHAGATGVLVPTARTRAAEVRSADRVAPDVYTAVRAFTTPDRDRPTPSAPTSEGRPD